jgi:hypothetical protein
MTDEMTPVTPIEEPSHIHVQRPSRQRDISWLDLIGLELTQQQENTDEVAA